MAEGWVGESRQSTESVVKKTGWREKGKVVVNGQNKKET